MGFSPIQEAFIAERGGGIAFVVVPRGERGLYGDMAKTFYGNLNFDRLYDGKGNCQVTPEEFRKCAENMCKKMVEYYTERVYKKETVWTPET